LNTGVLSCSKETIVRGVGCALYTSNAGKPSADLYTGKGKTIKREDARKKHIQLCQKRKTIKREDARKKHIQFTKTR